MVGFDGIRGWCSFVTALLMFVVVGTNHVRSCHVISSRRFVKYKNEKGDQIRKGKNRIAKTLQKPHAWSFSLSFVS